MAGGTALLLVGLSSLWVTGAEGHCQCYDCCETCFNNNDECAKDCPVCTSKFCQNHGIQRTTKRTGICYGPTNGCGGQSSHSTGCYGKDSSGSGGRCVCSEGAFSRAEKHKIGGVVNDLQPSQTLVLKVLFDSKEGGRLDKTLLGDVYKAGKFSFPMKFASGNTFKVSIHKQPHAQTCVLHQKSHTVGLGDVTDLSVTCFMKPGFLPKEKQLLKDQHQAMQKDMKKLIALSDDVSNCDDSQMLLATAAGMKVTSDQILNQDSIFPCKREYTLDRIQHNQIKFLEYLTEVRGQKCVDWEMEADNYMSACFVPAHQWLKMGTKGVLANETLCPCQGQIYCHFKQQTMANVTYAIVATSYGDDYKHGHGTKPLHLRLFVGRCGFTTQQKLMIGGGVIVFVCICLLIKSALASKNDNGYETLPQGKNGARYLPHQGL